jgi:16S rRNA (guanine(966)-N(2))-methyltransferase RsmD
MRIIAGEFRGRVLKSPPDAQTRPTSDRLRETLFNILAPRVADARFLDLCAGTGAVGIEALSRGASFVTFVDRSRKMCSLIETNLKLCRVKKELYEIVLSDARDFLKREQTHSWDIVFYDPPYQDDYAPVLNLFGESDSSFLNEDSLLIVEHHHKKLLPDNLKRLKRLRIVKQGDSHLSFYALDSSTSH